MACKYHGMNFFPTDAAGTPFSASVFAVTGEYIADLNEDLAAESKARVTYEHLMTLTDDPGVLKVLSFLREREIVHYQRFGELLNKYYLLQEQGKLSSFFYFILYIREISYLLLYINTTILLICGLNVKRIE